VLGLRVLREVVIFLAVSPGASQSEGLRAALVGDVEGSLGFPVIQWAKLSPGPPQMESRLWRGWPRGK